MITLNVFRDESDSTLISVYKESSFYIYRTDTNTVIARGINGFEAAKAGANQIRKSHNLN